jgi:hypothetical protein
MGIPPAVCFCLLAKHLLGILHNQAEVFAILKIASLSQNSTTFLTLDPSSTKYRNQACSFSYSSPLFGRTVAIDVKAALRASTSMIKFEMMLFSNRIALMSFAKAAWKAVVSKTKSAGRPKVWGTEAGCKCRVQSAVTSRLMIEASCWTLPSSKAERKARVVVSMRCLRFDVEAMMD